MNNRFALSTMLTLLCAAASNAPLFGAQSSASTASTAATASAAVPMEGEGVSVEQWVKSQAAANRIISKMTELSLQQQLYFANPNLIAPCMTPIKILLDVQEVLPEHHHLLVEKAATLANPGVIQMLISANIGGFTATALGNACGQDPNWNNREVIQLLLTNGASVSEAAATTKPVGQKLPALAHLIFHDGFKPTAFHNAKQSCGELLLNNNCAPNSKANINQPFNIKLDKITYRLCVLHLAAMHHWHNWVQWLLDRGADPSIVTSSGRNAEESCNQWGTLDQAIEEQALALTLTAFSKPKAQRSEMVNRLLPHLIHDLAHLCGEYLYPIKRTPIQKDSATLEEISN